MGDGGEGVLLCRSRSYAASGRPTPVDVGNVVDGRGIASCAIGFLLGEKLTMVVSFRLAGMASTRAISAVCSGT